jgi:hypothetical protein
MIGAPPRLVGAAVSDPDLDPLRDDPRFQSMLSQAEARVAEARHAATLPPEPSAVRL